MWFQPEDNDRQVKFELSGEKAHLPPTKTPLSYKEGSLQKLITAYIYHSGVYCSNAEVTTSGSNAVRFHML